MASINMLCCGENVIQLLVTLLHIMENELIKLIVIMKETFYICHLPGFSKRLTKIRTLL